MDKNHLLGDSGSVGLKLLVQRDITVGAHVNLSICTRVWNSSHRHLAPLDQVSHPVLRPILNALLYVC
jgi:hypothetical protein